MVSRLQGDVMSEYFYAYVLMLHFYWGLFALRRSQGVYPDNGWKFNTMAFAINFCFAPVAMLIAAILERK